VEVQLEHVCVGVVPGRGNHGGIHCCCAHVSGEAAAVTLPVVFERRLPVSLFLLILVASCAHAHSAAPITFGYVQGTVLDENGAPVAHVKIRIAVDGEVFIRETNGKGDFVFSGLAPRPTYQVCILGHANSCAVVNGPHARPITFMASGSH
jgi:hypothetical protein